MFSFLRSYFLYLYYWFSKKKAEKDGSGSGRLYGFFCVVFLFMFILGGIIAISLAVYPEQTQQLLEGLSEGLGRAKTHKGTVGVLPFLITLLFSTLSSYFVCCFRISYEEIPERLRLSVFLNSFSWIKVLTPYIFSLIVLIAYSLIN